MHNIFSTFFAMFSASSSLEEAYLNNHKINEFKSLHVGIYHSQLGNRGIPCSSCTTDHYLSLSNVLRMNEDN